MSCVPYCPRCRWQDPLGVAGDIIAKTGPSEVWAAPLAGGDRAVAMLSRCPHGPSANITVTWHQLGLAQTNGMAMVTDLFLGRVLGNYTGGFAALVPCRDVAIVRITPHQRAAADEHWRPWHSEEATAVQELMRARAWAMKRPRQRGRFHPPVGSQT
jgi:hypothetical protein